ncbi:hypothetical protein SNE40_013973 [Patella caerulea]|uniref:PAS domain-containing protein n=1 Tax=Patella caerulea TaxID=87958 RepID=A0AAN8PPU2_PATCE
MDDARQEQASKNSESTGYGYSCSSETRTQAVESLSSISISNTSNDFQQEMSTSGCSSSGIDKHQKYKQMKREKVKDCLNEIKALMSNLSKSKGKHGGTLSTLEQVLERIRKIHHEEGEVVVPKDNLQTAKANSDKDSQSEVFYVTLTCSKLMVIEVSENLTNHLGFRKDSWQGCSFTNFILRKDLATLNTTIGNLSSTDNAEESQLSKSFFARFKYFQDIFQGFTLDKTADYIPLHAKIVFKKGKNKLEPSWTYITDKSDLVEKCFTLKLQPCISAYTPAGASVEKSFSIRHSFNCKFTHLSKNTVQLLGYLPQDLLGTSIFNLLHPDNLEELLHTYRRVITMKGQPFKTLKMKLKTKNNDWITVETEWSCFVNPWSNQVEIIMGKHKVISGPKDPDIFKEKTTETSVTPTKLTELEVTNLQRKITRLLKQPVKAIASSSSLSEDNTGTNITSDDHFCESNTSFALPKAVSDSKKGESSSDIISPAESLPTDSDTYVSYGQLNYSYNIKRFLQSRPLTLSKLEANEQSGCDVKGVDEFMISIPSHQTAHTDDSSIKVNMSDQEVCIGSPHNVDEDSQQSIEMPPVRQVFTPVHLTQARLREHTKFQEKLYVQRVKKDKSIILPRPNQNSIILKVASCRKRTRSQHDTDNEDIAKGKRKIHISDADMTVKKALQNSNSLFRSKLPVCNTDTSKANKIPDAEFAPAGSNYGIFPQGLPIMSFESGNVDLYSGYDKQVGNKDVQWPCYSSPGCSFSPFVMGGLLHSGGELGPASDEHGNLLSVPWPACLQPLNFKMPHQSSNNSAEPDCSSTEEETNSSLYILLDSGNYPPKTYTGKNQQKIPTQHKSTLNMGVKPQWVEAVHWTQDTQMRYEMPTPNLQDVLKSDKEFLKHMISSDLIVGQLRELLGEISEESSGSNTSEDKNKETSMEDMFKLGHQLQVHMESRVQEELMATHSNAINFDNTVDVPNCNADDVANHNIFDITNSNSDSLMNCSAEDLGNCNNDELLNCDSVNVESINSDISETNEILNMLSPKSSKTDMSSKRDMSVSSEGSSDEKIVSDITPSDQTSTGDSASSLKESDGTNEKYLVRRQKKTKEIRAPFYDKLFKRLPSDFDFVGNSSLSLGEPFWLQNVSLTEDFSYRYQIDTPELSNQLVMDREFLDSNSQPPIIQEELDIDSLRNFSTGISPDEDLDDQF